MKNKRVLKSELAELIKDIREHFQRVPNVDMYTFEESGLMERIDDVVERLE